MRAAYLLIFILVAVINKSSSQGFLDVGLPDINVNGGSAGDLFDFLNPISNDTNGGLISSGPSPSSSGIVSGMEDAISATTSIISSALSPVIGIVRALTSAAESLNLPGADTFRDILAGNSTDPISAVVRNVISFISSSIASLIPGLESAVRQLSTIIQSLVNGDDISLLLESLRSILESSISEVASVIERIVSLLPGIGNIASRLFNDTSSGSDVIRRVLSQATNDGMISLSDLIGYIDMAIDNGDNTTAATLGNLRAALTGGGTRISDIIRRAIYSVPGASSGNISLSNLRSSIESEIANGGSEVARALDPLRAALSDEDSRVSDFFGGVISLVRNTISGLWQFLSQILNNRALLVFLGPVGSIISLALSVVLGPIWDGIYGLSSSGASLIIGGIWTILRSVLNFGIDILYGILRLAFAPIIGIWNTAIALLNFVGSLLFNGILTILNPFLSIIILGIRTVWGAITLVFSPITVISNVVYILSTPFRSLINRGINIVLNVIRAAFYPILLPFQPLLSLIRLLFGR